MSRTVTKNAKHLRYGELFTDEMGHRHRVEAVEQLGHGVYITVTGQACPEFYLNDHQVTVYVPYVDPKPFKVYTRDYKANGDCDKRIFEFPSRAKQASFVARTHRCVTFTN